MLRQPAVVPDLLERVAPLRLHHQHVPDELFALLRHEVRYAELAGHHHAAQIVQRVAVEGKGTAHQHVQQHPEAPDVRLGPVVLHALEYLRGGVRGRATPRPKHLSGDERVAEAEVSQLHVHLRVEQDVLRLQVPVHDPIPVAVVERGHDLREDAGSLLLPHAPVRDQMVEDLTLGRVLRYQSGVCLEVL
uniref:Uncharacterized protein n=1 Tax=Anopheles atroparvus TaxID=41427 RepID=A0A182J6B2_ANOAO